MFRNSPAAGAGIQIGDIVLQLEMHRYEPGVKEMVAHVQSFDQGSSLPSSFYGMKEVDYSIVLAPFPNQRKLLEQEEESTFSRGFILCSVQMKLHPSRN